MPELSFHRQERIQHPLLPFNLREMTQRKDLEKRAMTKRLDDTTGLTSLGGPTHYNAEEPSASILEAFPNKHPERHYRIQFEHPEFTSLCPKTGQPDFGVITINYVPDKLCVESKSFKLYMVSFRNQGAFMESITNTIADDLISVLHPRRLTIEGKFNVRGGTGITVTVDHVNPALKAEDKAEVLRLW